MGLTEESRQLLDQSKLDSCGEISEMTQTYTAKLKTRKQMEKDIPIERMGWWRDVCPGMTLQNLREATQADIARCCLNEGSSRNPGDYLCENIPGGALVSREAIAQLTVNQ